VWTLLLATAIFVVMAMGFVEEDLTVVVISASDVGAGAPVVTVQK
jgi:hypothetical protein